MRADKAKIPLGQLAVAGPLSIVPRRRGKKAVRNKSGTDRSHTTVRGSEALLTDDGWDAKGDEGGPFLGSSDRHRSVCDAW